MKWGKKKPCSSSSPCGLSNSPVFPLSWISRFKKMSGNSESKPANERRKGGKNLPTTCWQTRPSWNEGRFYGGDDEAYWRLSFGEERIEGEKSRGGLKSVWYDSDEEFNVPLSSSQCSERRKVREFPQYVEILQGNDSCQGEVELKTRRKVSKEKRPHNLEEKEAEFERKLGELEENSTKSVQKDVFEQRDNQKLRALHSPRQHSNSFSNFVSREIEEECVFEELNLEETNASMVKKLKDMKEREEEKLKNQKQRKSVYFNRKPQRRRAKQSSKTKACSMKMTAKIECKIRALENMKKAKSKIKKVEKERTGKSTTAFDSFAVVKSSLDPEQDFIDSMVEMITEKGIRQPDELEELLACYLTLNHDEHHDLIIKVFRQVWSDLNQVPSDTEVQFEHCCNN